MFHQKKIENWTFNNTWKYLFCGPFTKLYKKLTEGYDGVNILVVACKKNDLAYKKYRFCNINCKKPPRVSYFFILLPL